MASYKHLIYLLQRLIYCIDELLCRQLNAIMHYPCFKRVEASWRGLSYLVNQLAEENNKAIKLKIISIAWRELAKDLTRAVEFDQSQLFKQIYSNEFGQPGGEPFGLLLGDYYISHQKHENCVANDITILQAIAKIAAAAFTPFIAAAAPALFGLDNFKELEKPLNFVRTFQQWEYQQWHNLRQDEDAHFIGLVLPQVLMRLPYNQLNAIHYPFCFSEEAITIQQYLWGNAAYCFAVVIAKMFNHSGWFIDNHGKRKFNAAKAVKGLVKQAADIYITDQKEKLLSDAGFITLTNNQYSHSFFFYTFPSVQGTEKYKDLTAKQNHPLSCKLNYLLCVARFAHYLKVITRDKVGCFSSAKECEIYLQNWLYQYTAASLDLNDALKAQYPLREAKVTVHESKGNPGKYLCTIRLLPHYQFEQIESYLQFKTELAGYKFYA